MTADDILRQLIAARNHLALLRGRANADPEAIRRAQTEVRRLGEAWKGAEDLRGR